METRYFESIGREISLLGFGCMRLPRLYPDRQDIDYPLAEKMIALALERGVNYFDTAWPYHEGGSESFIGHALKKYPRASFNLATKMPTWELKSAADAERIFAAQLKKCRVEYFDFYLAHNMSVPHYKILRETGLYEVLRRKKEEGLIRRLGFSFHDNSALLSRILEDYAWDFAQIQLNYLDWDDCDAKGLYSILSGRGIPVVIMEPVRGGALATLNPRAVELLKAAAPEASPASWAIRYAASLPGVLTVLSGMSSLEQVEDNLRSMEPFKALSAEERLTLGRAAEAYRASGLIPCTGCRYCMDCPSGVDIPRIFSIYNHARPLDESVKFRLFPVLYSSLLEEERAHNCIACGQCAEHCPQSIAIPERLREVAAYAQA